MKIHVSCFKCSTPEDPRPPSLLAELREDGLYLLRCNSGHTVAAAIQNPRFELLMDSGALALRDEYFRESVVSFAAAQEAFWGFYVRVVAVQMGATPEQVEQLRKETKLAERRIGAMHVAHFALTKRVYESDTNARRQFRNGVVHEGHFPQREQAHDFGKYVYEAIVQGMDQLRALADESAQRVIALDLARTLGPLHRQPGRVSPTVCGMHTLVSYAFVGQRLSFSDALSDWNAFNCWDLAEELARGTAPGVDS